jgi:hypothetical protein
MALTFVEVLTLSRDQLFGVQDLPQYEYERGLLRWYLVRHAARRGILMEAARRRAIQDGTAEVEALPPYSNPNLEAKNPVKVQELMEEVEDLRDQLDGVLQKLAVAKEASNASASGAPTTLPPLYPGGGRPVDFDLPIVVPPPPLSARSGAGGGASQKDPLSPAPEPPPKDKLPSLTVGDAGEPQHV